MHSSHPDDAQAFSRSGLARYFTNTLWLVIGFAAQTILGFLVTVVVARWLGPAQFGMLNYQMSVVLIISVIVSLGLGNLVGRGLVLEADSHGGLIGTALALSVCAGIAGFLALVAAWGLDPADPQNLLGVIMGVALLFHPFRLLESWFQARVRSQPAVAAATAGLVVGAAVKFGLVLAGAGTLWFGAAFTLEALVVACLLVLFYRRDTARPIEWRFMPAQARTLLGESLAMMLSDLSVIVLLRIDQVMLQRLCGDESVGVYAAATRLSTIWYFVPILLGRSLFPAIVRLHREQPELYNQRLRQYFELSMLLAALIMLGTLAASPWIVGWVFGHSYAGGGRILAVHCLSMGFVFMGVARSQVLIAEGLTMVLVVANVCAALLNILANLLLIPSYGGMGAAWATLLALAGSGLTATLVHPRARSLAMTQVRACLVFVRIRELVRSLTILRKLRR